MHGHRDLLGLGAPARPPALGLARAGTVRVLGGAWLGLLAIVCAGLLVHDAREETVAIHGVDGTMVTNAANAGILQSAIEHHPARDQALGADPARSAGGRHRCAVADRCRGVLPQLSACPASLDGPAPRRTA